jgi:hypothetical protein
MVLLPTNGTRGLFCWSKMIFILPPPSENNIFSPSRDMSFFHSCCELFALILPYFAFIFPFTSPFLCFFPPSSFFSPFFLFLSPFFLFLSFFFLFLLYFCSFSLPLFILFSPNDSRFFPLPGGGGYFPIYRPLYGTVQKIQQGVEDQIC